MFEVKHIVRCFKIMKEGYTGEYAEGIRWSCGQVTIHTSANMGTFRNMLPVDAMTILNKYVKGSEGLSVEWIDEPRDPAIDMPWHRSIGWAPAVIIMSVALAIAAIILMRLNIS